MKSSVRRDAAKGVTSAGGGDDHIQLSVVVPARNEGSRLPETIRRLELFCSRRGHAEVVLAVDVESEDETVAIAEKYALEDSLMKVVRVRSRGKGYALLTGIEAASGEIVLTADADLAVEPDQFESLIAASSAGSIAIASRSVDGAKRIDEPLMRYVLGRAFNALVRWLVLPGIRDSQCGFKAFHRDPIRSVLADARTGGWVFDVEFLALARRHGFSIKEIPVRWFYRHGSTVRPLRDAPGVISELWRLRRTVGRVHGR